MSNYVILQQSTGVDLTGGFNNSYYGTGSSSNPSLSKTNNLYQWRASFNAEYNAPSVHSFPKIFANNIKLLSKYKKLESHIMLHNIHQEHTLTKVWHVILWILMEIMLVLYFMQN